MSWCTALFLRLYGRRFRRGKGGTRRGGRAGASAHARRFRVCLAGCRPVQPLLAQDSVDVILLAALYALQLVCCAPCCRARHADAVPTARRCEGWRRLVSAQAVGACLAVRACTTEHLRRHAHRAGRAHLLVRGVRQRACRGGRSSLPLADALIKVGSTRGDCALVRACTGFLAATVACKTMTK